LDTVQVMDAELAAAVYAVGVRTVFRYLDRVKDITTGRLHANLTPHELDVLLDAGLCVSPVQYYSTGYASQAKGKKLSADYGAEMGQVACSNALALGVPQGVTLWRDLEDVPNATPDAIIADCKAWGRVVVNHGFEAGLYVGAGLGSQETGYLRGEQLWELPYYRSYWRAASVVPQLPKRGWCVIQGNEQTMKLQCGDKVRELHVDFDMIALDHRYQADRHRGDESPGRFMAIGA
jgi:hypothetical protein